MYVSTTRTCTCADRGSLNAAAAMPYPRSDRQNPVSSSYASLSTAAAAAGSLPWESVRAQWRAIARVTECEADRGRVDWKAWAAWRDLVDHRVQEHNCADNAACANISRSRHA